MSLLSNAAFVTLLMFIWGLAVKHWPLLKPIPNNLMPFMNLVIGIIAKLAAPEPANAFDLSGAAAIVANALGWFLPLVQVIAARQLHETFFRPAHELRRNGKGATA